MTKDEQIRVIEKDWAENPRWQGITRPFSAADVLRLRGSVQIEHTLAKIGADRLWNLMNETEYVYNCSPSFNWKKKLDDEMIAKFQTELGKMGYKFQFITLTGFHSLNYAMFELARNYKESGMTAYSKLQEQEFDSEADGYRATKHQAFVGTGYFDAVAQVITGGLSLVAALKGSTEEDQFEGISVSEEQITVAV